MHACQSIRHREFLFVICLPFSFSFFPFCFLLDFGFLDNDLGIPRNPEMTPQPHQFQSNYSPDQRMYQRNFGPQRSPIGLARPFPMHHGNPPQVWNGAEGRFPGPRFRPRRSPGFGPPASDRQLGTMLPWLKKIHGKVCHLLTGRRSRMAAQIKQAFRKVQTSPLLHSQTYQNTWLPHLVHFFLDNLLNGRWLLASGFWNLF